MLIFNLITFENKKDFVFMFDDFNFKMFILIINENNKVFIVKAIAGNNKIANIIMT